MTIKLTALLTSACVAILFVFSVLSPNDLYFFLISSYFAVALARVIICALLIILAYKKRFYWTVSHKICLAGGATLVAFGIAGIIIPPLTYSLFTFFKPMDFIFAIEAGLMFALAGVTYGRGKHALPRLSRPRTAQLWLHSILRTNS